MTPPDEQDLTTLIDRWITVPDVVQRYDVPLAWVRRIIDERAVLAHRIGDRKILSIPQDYFDDEGPIPSLAGTITVLSDARLTDEEITQWLFSPQRALPGDCATPIEALRAGHRAEIRRRAMEESF